MSVEYRSDAATFSLCKTRPSRVRHLPSRPWTLLLIATWVLLLLLIFGHMLARAALRMPLQVWPGWLALAFSLRGSGWLWLALAFGLLGCRLGSWLLMALGLRMAL